MQRGLDQRSAKPGLRATLRRATAAAAASLLAVVSPAVAQPSQEYSFIQHVTYEGGQQNQFPATARVWLPDAGTPLRGMAVFTMMDRAVADFAIQRNAAAALGFGVIATDGSLSGMRAVNAQQTVDSLLSGAAAATGRGQVANLPIVPFGFSGGGNDAMRVAQRNPSRVITHVSNRISPDSQVDRQPGWQALSGLYLPGALDTNQQPSEVYAGVMKGGLNNGFYLGYGVGDSVRERGGLAAMGVLLGRGHSNDALNNPASPGYEFAWYWVARNAAARLPGTPASSTPGSPVTLNSLSETSGWLAETDQYVATGGEDTPGGTSAFKRIAAHADYTGDKGTASWLVDRDLALAFRAAMSNDSSSASRFPGPLNTPLEFASIAPLQSFAQGAVANLAINLRDFAAAGTTITRMDFYDGATLLGSDTLAGDGWGITVPLTESGIRGLSVIATRSDGEVRTSFRAVAVQAVPEPASLGVLVLAAAATLRRMREHV